MRHTQIFIRAQITKPLLLPTATDAFMRRAVAAAGMQIIGGPHSVLGIIPGNEGVSSVVVLDFSSAALHEWPDARPYPIIHFDLYTCGKPPDENKFRELFSDLGIISYNCKVIDRDRFLEVE